MTCLKVPDWLIYIFFFNLILSSFYTDLLFWNGLLLLVLIFACFYILLVHSFFYCFCSFFFNKSFLKCCYYDLFFLQRMFLTNTDACFKYLLVQKAPIKTHQLQSECLSNGIFTGGWSNNNVLLWRDFYNVTSIGTLQSKQFMNAHLVNVT